MATRVYRRRGRGVGCFGGLLILVVAGAVWWALSHLWPLFLAVAVLYVTYKVARRVTKKRKAKHDA